MRKIAFYQIIGNRSTLAFVKKIIENKYKINITGTSCTEYEIITKVQTDREFWLYRLSISSWCVSLKLSFVPKDLYWVVSSSREQVYALERLRPKEFLRIVRDLHRYSSFRACNCSENYEAFKFNASCLLCAPTDVKNFYRSFLATCSLFRGFVRFSNVKNGSRKYTPLIATSFLCATNAADSKYILDWQLCDCEFCY